MCSLVRYCRMHLIPPSCSNCITSQKAWCCVITSIVYSRKIKTLLYVYSMSCSLPWCRIDSFAWKWWIHGFLPAAGFSWREGCARFTLIGCWMFSSNSSLDKKLQTNSMGLPFSSTSGILTILMLCLRERASRSSTFVWSSLFWEVSSERLASNSCRCASCGRWLSALG